MFTCMSCRVVQIEITHSFDTDSFILALRCLIARGGNVQSIFSDNGSNFIGSENELRRALEEMDKEKLQSFMQASGGDWITWKREPRQLTTLVIRLLSVWQQSDQTTLVISLPLSPLNLLTMKSKIILPPSGYFSRPDLNSRRRWRRVQHWMNSGVAGGKNYCNHFKKGRNGQTFKETWRLEILWSCKKQTPSGMIGRCLESCKRIVMKRVCAKCKIKNWECRPSRQE